MVHRECHLVLKKLESTRKEKQTQKIKIKIEDPWILMSSYLVARTKDLDRTA